MVSGSSFEADPLLLTTYYLLLTTYYLLLTTYYLLLTTYYLLLTTYHLPLTTYYLVTLRLTTPTDISALQRIAIDTQVDTFGAYNTEANMKAYLDEVYTLDKLRQELDEPGSHNYLAIVDSQLAGFMRLRLSTEVEYLLGKNTLELQRLYVDKAFHGQGIGAALMREAMEVAKAGGYEWIWLGVWERNFRAQEFYSRWGFERFSEHIFQMGDDPQTDWLLKKRVEG